jgi:hypothetical protein
MTPHGLWRTLVCAAAALAGAAPFTTVQGQDLIRFHSAADSASSIPRLELADTVYPRTYWAEGAVIGGTVLGLLGAVLAGGLCSDPDSGGGGRTCWDDTLLGLATGLGVGGSLGALIGGQFRKKKRPPEGANLEVERTAAVDLPLPAVTGFWLMEDR